MDKIRSVLLTGPENATFIPIKVSRIIWGDDYLSTRLIGPKAREPRKNERSLFVPDDELQKLKGK